MLRALTACCLIVVALPCAAAAEWHFVPAIGTTFNGKTSLVDLEHATDKAHRNLGGSVALLGGGILGAEGLFVWTPGFFQAGDQDLIRKSRVVEVMGNVVLTTPRRWTEYTLRPFVSGGFGLIDVLSADVSEALPVPVRLASYNIGGGAIGFFSHRAGVRFDLRYHSSISRTDEGPVAIGPVYFGYMTATVGVVLRR